MSNLPETANQAYEAILEALNHLIEVVAKLRSPDGGCPWDLEQTPQTLIPYIIEEAYEVVYAIKSDDSQAIVEELGDLLLQVVLQAQIASDYGNFSLKEVAQGITEKLISRHPHVFGNVQVTNTEEVRQNWEQIKALEKGETPEMAELLSRKLTHYNRTLPPLMASSKISVKAAKAGFEWENVEGVWDKFSEELAEFKESLESDDKVHQTSELGDLLFTLINLARWYGLDASDALSGTNERFIQRVSKMETFANRPLSDYTLDELDTLWKQAKKHLNQ
ncbi:nucleoside triphosphate pyrophosphohydrolase [Aphanothece sacrum]|uniref:Nucleoside triphosphate pyrophosphohydrolase MazG n=1 Tax=Aphanothece sacrum FPU1 TaxID=1920663 RepID=A0A401II50_APHSA|nr:nucleoside triphosphate pyrophosphohydrolase [Aphanothece sacrum]GBF80850.1 nucleoside triphosphate pyrophosphohydrolase MazG [Aphanothece sacrum FPU1]